MSFVVNTHIHLAKQTKNMESFIECKRKKYKKDRQKFISIRHV